MGFNQFGNSTTINDIIKERRGDIAEIDTLKRNKSNERDRTGLRNVPINPNEILQGDMIGDIVDTLSHRYKLTKTQWIRWEIEISW